MLARSRLLLLALVGASLAVPAAASPAMAEAPVEVVQPRSDVPPQKVGASDRDRLADPSQEWGWASVRR